MNTTRIPLPTVQAIQLSATNVERSAGQQFYRTNKAYELWQETPDLMRLKRWDGKRVFWTYEVFEQQEAA
jgi:hypothetical protein